MAQTSVFEQGIDRFQETFKDVDRQVQRVRRELARRRRSLEREIQKRRADLEKLAGRQVRRLRTELRRSPAFRRAESLQAGARQRLERQIDQVRSAIPVASRGDVESLERKIAGLTRRVRQLEKSNGIAES
jgi:polyhydroxyalkanoate synthesis regulator phasin